MAQQRIEYIDTAKGICIILVVFLHIQEFFPIEYPTDTFLSLMRMPLYYFLSGLFFKQYDDFRTFTVKKVNKLIIPFLFFYYLTCLIFNFSHYVLHIGINDMYGWSTLFAYLYKDMYLNLYLWFLLSLFTANIIYYVLILLFKNNKAIISMIVGCMGVIGFILFKNNIFIPTFFEKTLFFFPFFFMGNLFKEYGFLNININKYQTLGLTVVFLLLTIFISQYIDHSYFIIRLISTYVSSICAVLFIIFFSIFINTIPIVTWYGKYSIMLLVTHALVNQAFSYFIIQLPISNQHILLLIFFTLVMLSYLLIIPLMKKYLPYVTAQKDFINISSKSL